MYFLPYLAAFLLVQHIRKSLKTTMIFPKWSNLITITSWGLIALYVLTTIYLDNWVNDISSGLILFGVLYYIYREPDLQYVKPFASTHIPLATLVIISGLAKLIYQGKAVPGEDYFELAVICAFIWIFGRGATFKKQQKEVELYTVRNAELESMVAQRTVELTRQKDGLQQALQELKATQQQLIQAEKMASLGELTAGIAHEIQNPLNFVNNFSEVSIELLDELKEEAEAGNAEDVLAIAGDLTQNLEKIRHHGKRADSIVKGMLQHSRATSGQKEPVNINALADEYLRLAYHGLRAKDKGFNASFITHFGENLPLINAVPQDVGRVLLNLFNNAFYAVQQKQKTAGADFKPTVEVSTAQQENNIQIVVKDNGTGIPGHIKDKIMQPFFTTKPTGEGTGLGLSMSYDIVVKGHGGKFDVDTAEGTGAEFKISLPLNA